MKPVRRFLRRLRASLLGPRDEDRLRDEIAQHIAFQTADNLRGGMPPAEARRQALLKFGAVEAIKEDYRDRRGLPFLDNLRRDTRFALRQMVRNPGFSATAIVMLALGMCAGVAIFAFVDAALLRPLPYRDPTRVVGVYEKIPVCPRCNLSYLDYLDWKAQNTVFSAFDAYSNNGFLLTTPEGVEQGLGARVTAGFFRTLGVTPVLGRDFAPGEDLASAPFVVLISYSAWQQRFGGRPDALGQSVILNGAPATVIGVLPRDFHFAPAEPADFWTGLRPSGGCYDRRSCHNLYGVARLKDGVPVATALAGMKTIAQQLEKQYPDSNLGQGAEVVSLADVVLGPVRPVLLVLLAGAGLLLLIAGVNVAGLLLVRSESRRREIAVRSAMGGSAARLIGQFVTEGVLLAGAGSAIGLLNARWLIQLLRGLIPLPVLAGMPYLRELGFSGRVSLFAAAIALLAAALFSLTPLSRLSLPRIRESLATGTRGSAGLVWRNFGSKLVVLELVIAVVLLVGAGLLGRSLNRLLHVDLGFEPDRLATLRIGAARYATPEKSIALERRIFAEAAALPGVQSAALSTTLPLVGGNTVWVRVEGRPYHGEHWEVAYRSVSAGYFTTLRARLLRGRYFTDAEDASKPAVAVVDRNFANQFLPGENPIGKRILYAPTTTQPPIEIVGMVETMKEGAADKDTLPTLYVAFNQNPGGFFSLVVRTSQAAEAALPSLAASIRHIDPSIAAFGAFTMSQRLDNSSAAYLRRASAWLVGGFAVFALLLSVVGLYGVVAYSVSCRTREIGVRMALGARRRSVYRLILGESGRLSAIGIVAGLGLSVAASTLLGSLLFGVRPWDIPTLTAVAVLLGLAALFASFLPARRAASIDPVEALRTE